MRVLLHATANDQPFHVNPDELVEAVVKALSPLTPGAFDQRDVFVTESGHDLHLVDCHALFKVEFADATDSLSGRVGDGIAANLAEAIENALQSPFSLSNRPFFNFLVWVTMPTGQSSTKMVKMAPNALLR